MRLWKPQPKSLPKKPVKYPDGLALDTGENVWYTKNGLLYKCYSQRTLDSWRFKVIKTTPEAVAGFKQGGILGFRDGTLLRDISDGKLYLVSGNKRRHIVSPDFFDLYGFEKSDAVLASRAEIELHQPGEPIE